MSNLRETPLHAVANGKYESQEDGVRVARLLLEHGADVNARDEAHWTPLHLASFCGKVEIVQLLLNHSAKSKARGGRGETPLHRVSCGKCKPQDGVRIAQLLLEFGVNVNTEDKDQRTPLHVASNYGKLEIARLLLSHGADVYAVDRYGNTPLHHISRGKYDFEEAGIDVARLLSECGRDVNRQNKNHWTPLHFASYYGEPKIARLLLDCGAKVNALDNLGRTPLHNVSRGEYDSKEAGISIAQLLLQSGGDVNQQTKEQWTPLHFSSYNGKPEITQVLLDHGANVDAVDNLGRTPLHDVSRGKYDSKEAGIGVARLLLQYGGDVNQQTKGQWTPSHFASYNGKPEITQVLLDHGAKVDAVDNLGRTPLHNVSRGKYDSNEAGISVAQLLLRRGGNVNRQSKYQRTPLHFASYNGKLDIAQVLLDHGAKVGAVDALGRTPLHNVSRGEFDYKEAGISVARLLLQCGGDVNQQAKNQWTPLHFASHNGKPEITQVLLDHGAKVGTVTNWSYSALHEVSVGVYDSEEAGTSVAQLLLEHGANVNAKASGKTPFDLASDRGRYKLAHFLREHTANGTVQRPRANPSWTGFFQR